MMHKKLTFLVFNQAGKPLQQKTISAKLIWFLGVSLVVCAAVVGWGAYDYYGLKKNQALADRLAEKLTCQTEALVQQRQAIQKYADDINRIKGKLSQVTELERKIRVIANLEGNDSQSGVFGIGGAFPEDLDARSELNQSPGSLIREINQHIDVLEKTAEEKKERLPVLMEKLEKERNLLLATPSIWPAKGWLASKFGYRSSPFAKAKDRVFHKGIDVSANIGTPIYATANGTVTFSGHRGSLGKMIVIDHGHGLVTKYAHNHKLLKKKGDTVKRGDHIALVGNTGRSTGPHVHYEVHLNGMPVNPLNYIFQ